MDRQHPNEGIPVAGITPPHERILTDSPIGGFVDCN